MTLDSKSHQQWLSVTDIMQLQPSISLGTRASHWYRNSPRKLLEALTYYKFAAKLIGKSKKVLDVCCGEGLGTYLLAKECGWVKGIDSNQDAIALAKSNFHESIVEFACEDILTAKPAKLYDAIVSFNVIEHIPPAASNSFWDALLKHLKPEGVLIIGTPHPSIQAGVQQQEAFCTYPRSCEQLEQECSEFFNYVFVFGASGEVVHTSVSTDYHLVVACKAKG